MAERYRTIEEVEASGVWVSARHSGKSHKRLSAWVKRKQLKPTRDYFRERVLVTFENGTVEPITRYFFRRTALEALAAFAAADCRPVERITEGETVLVSRQAACRLLKVDPATLEEWSVGDGGCPAMGGERLTRSRRPVFPGLDREDWYWFLRPLEKAAAALATLTETPGGGDVYGREEAAELLGLSPWTIRRKEQLSARDLRRVERRARVIAKQKDGGQYVRSTSAAAFTKASVDAHVANHPAPTVPPDMMTRRDASKRLGLVPTTVLLLLSEGILKGDPVARIPTPAGPRTGALLTRTSVEELRKLIHGATTARQKQTILCRIRRERAAPDPLADPQRFGEPMVGNPLPKFARVEASPATENGKRVPFLHDMTEESRKELAKDIADAMRGGQQTAPTEGKATPKRGRRKSPQTWELYKFCYDQYVTEDKSERFVMREANQRFGAGKITDEARVRDYAGRYAGEHFLPRKGEKTPKK